MAGRLTARKVTTAKAGKYSDGNNLYLVVSRSGSRKWVLRFTWRGQAKEMGLGSASSVPLSGAREKAAVAVRALEAGQNPIAERKRTGGIPTFGEMADEVVAALSPGFRNQKHRAQWTSTLATYAAPLRNMPVDTVSTDDVLSVLKPIWTVKPETASRVRGRIEKVLDAAKAKGFRAGENPAHWRGHLDHLLPRPSKLTRGHHAAMPYEEVPAFIASLRERDALAAVALELCILTAARSGELLGMRWDEIDFQNAVWSLPAGRMKAGRPHRVPLSTRALAMLRKLEQSKHGEFVFAGHAPGRPLSEHGDGHDPPPNECRRDCTWLPIQLPRLGRERNLIPARGRRNRPGPRHRRQGRAGLSPQRRAGEAPQADGGMGVLLHGGSRSESRAVQEKGAGP